MLTRLTIKNLAVVEKAEVEFSPALNVLTGETGAGKSVVVGAIDLVLGARSDSSMVREGAAEALIEAEFSLVPGEASFCGVNAILSDAGIDADEDGCLVIRRAVSSTGGGKIRINDSSATLATLRKLRRFLVDIHGPRSNQSVLEERFQRETLDSWGMVDLSGYRKAYGRFKDISSRREKLQASGRGEDELDVLRFQISEIESAGLGDDDETLPERHAAAAHAGEIAECAEAITEALGGEGSASETIIRLAPRFATMARHIEAAEEWRIEAEEIVGRIHDLSRSIADRISRMEIDSSGLEELDRRLTLVNRLKRKYGSTVVCVLEKLEEKKRRLDEIERRDEIIAQLRKEESIAAEEVAAEGALVTKARKAAASGLAKAVTAELRDLGFLQAGFSVMVSAADADENGMDRIVYLFEPNPGEPARSLSDIASSGEIARVMLALKSVLARHDQVDVLVFDEIDANIGGETGKAVGAKMRSVASSRQVIAITHLPQSAVYGQRHLVVSKSVLDGRTKTFISPVEGERRVSEIARMLGGETLTSVVKRHAQELLTISR